MLGIKDAGHAESMSGGPQPFIGKLRCSLAGESKTVELSPGTAVFQAYKRKTVVEQYNCAYGLNEAFRDTLVDRKLKIVGVDAEGEARVVELSGHRFFIATLFLPQLSSSRTAPHPLVMAFLQAAVEFQSAKPATYNFNTE